MLKAIEDLIERVLDPRFCQRTVNQAFLVAFESKLLDEGFGNEFCVSEMRKLGNCLEMLALAKYIHRSYERHVEACRHSGETPCAAPDFAMLDNLPYELDPMGAPSRMCNDLVFICSAYRTEQSLLVTERLYTERLKKDIEEMTASRDQEREERRKSDAEAEALQEEVKKLKTRILAYEQQQGGGLSWREQNELTFSPERLQKIRADWAQVIEDEEFREEAICRISRPKGTAKLRDEVLKDLFADERVCLGKKTNVQIAEWLLDTITYGDKKTFSNLKKAVGEARPR